MPTAARRTRLSVGRGIVGLGGGDKVDEVGRPESQFLVYADVDGRLKIDVRLDGETVWLTQQGMADLFQTSKQNISVHVRNVIAEGELSSDRTVK
jgi:hypothetical protein